MTYDAKRLVPKHLEQLSLAPSALERIHFAGAADDGPLRDLVARSKPHRRDAIRDELVEVAKSLVADHPDIGALVLECTQMPMFGADLQEALGRKIPVYDVHTMGQWFYSGLVRRMPEPWKVEVTDKYIG